MTLRQHEWPTLEQSLLPSLLQHFVFYERPARGDTTCAPLAVQVRRQADEGDSPVPALDVTGREARHARPDGRVPAHGVEEVHEGFR